MRNFSGWEKSRPEEALKCKKAYQSYFKDGVFRITIGLGYHDSPAQGMALDQETESMLLESLTSPCKDPLDTICGFQIIERPFASSTILERTSPYGYFLEMPDPKFRIEIAHSSWSQIDRENFSGGQLRTEQIQTSEYSQELFFESIAGQSRPPCQLCIYMGHSRNGGGPDFKPVPLDWSHSGRKPIYANYLKNRTNFRRLISSLESRNPKLPMTLALLGCNSLPNFFGKKNRVCALGKESCSPKSLADFTSTVGLVLSEKLSWPSSRPIYFAAILDSFLGLKCDSSIQANTEAIQKKTDGKESYRAIGQILPNPEP